MIVCCEIEQTAVILNFASRLHYMVTVDEQTVMHALFSTYLGQPLLENYSLIRLLIKAEVTYAIKVTEKNRKAI